MESEWPYAVTALVLVAVVMLSVYLVHERPRRRRSAELDGSAAAAAARHGWQFEGTAPEMLGGFAFPPFDRVTENGARVLRVVSGTNGGLGFRAFDLEHERPVGEHDEAFRYHVLTVALPARATAISVAPASLQLDTHARLTRLPRREPLLEVPLEDRPDLRVLTASRHRAAAVVPPVTAVLDDLPDVGWGVDGHTVLLIRGGPADRRAPGAHWVEDVDRGLAALRRIDEALPTPLLRRTD